jgi:hypothetical protein
MQCYHVKHPQPRICKARSFSWRCLLTGTRNTWAKNAFHTAASCLNSYLGNSWMKTRAPLGNLSALAGRGATRQLFLQSHLGCFDIYPTYCSSQLVLYPKTVLITLHQYHSPSTRLPRPETPGRDGAHLNQFTPRWFCLARTLPKTSPPVPDREAGMAKQPLIPRFVSFLKAIRAPKAPARGLKATC